MAQAKVGIRLGTEGKSEVKRDFQEVAAAGDAAANRATRAFERASQDMESAQRRQAAAASKIAAITPQTATQARINMAVGTGASVDEGSARASAAAFRELIAEQEAMERKALSIRAALDPLWAVQQRVNGQMAEAARLHREGHLSADLYAQAQDRLQAELDQTAASIARNAQAQRDANQNKVNALLGVGTSSAIDNGAGYGALAAAMEQMEQKAHALRAAIDPVWAAQQRFNTEMAEARTLISAGAITLDEYVGKLRMEQAALDQSRQSHGRVTASSGAMRSGLQQAGFQFQDFFVQVNGGTDAVRAFSMQAPQLIGNLQMMTYGAEKGAGRFATFARYLGGPWGVALGIAIPAGALLAETLFKDADASKAAEEAAKKHKAAVDALSQSMRDSIKTAEDKARANYTLLESERLAAIQAERRLQIDLQRYKEIAEAAKGSNLAAGGPNGAQSIVANQYAAEVERLEKELAASRQRVADASKDATIAAGQYQRTIIEQMITPRGRVTRDYDQRINAAIGRGDAEAIARLTKARDAELKKIDETDKALRTSTKALTDFLMPVNGTVTSGFGQRGAPTAGASTNHKGIDIGARAGTDVRAPAVGVVEVVGYSDSLGKFVVINHGGGTKTRYGHLSDNSMVANGESVGQGDVIGKVGSTGRSTGPHLHYEVVVNGKQVDPRKGLFPTDGSAVEIAAATKDATAAQRELDTALAGLMQRLDPAAASAQAYREELEKIAALTGAGKITGEQAADWKANLRAQNFLPNLKDELQPDVAADQKRGDDEGRRRETVAQMLADLEQQNIYLDAERGLIRDSNDNRDLAIAKLRIIADLKREGIDLEASDARAIIEATEATEAKRQAVAQMAQQWAEVQRVGEAAIDRLFDPTSAESWGERVKGVLQDILNEMFVMAALNPLKNMLFNSGLPTMGGGGGGLLGGLFKAAIGAASGGGHDFVPVGSAIGHDYTPAGAMLVGENGPEIVNMPRGARVMTASDTRRAMGGGGTVQAPVSIRIDATGADAAGLARVEAQLAQLRSELPGTIVSTVSEAQSRLMLRGGGGF